MSVNFLTPLSLGVHPIPINFAVVRCHVCSPPAQQSSGHLIALPVEIMNTPERGLLPSREPKSHGRHLKVSGTKDLREGSLTGGRF